MHFAYSYITMFEVPILHLTNALFVFTTVVFLSQTLGGEKESGGVITFEGQ